jgi:hypothetical protein
LEYVDGYEREGNTGQAKWGKLFEELQQVSDTDMPLPLNGHVRDNHLHLVM